MKSILRSVAVKIYSISLLIYFLSCTANATEPEPEWRVVSGKWELSGQQIIPVQAKDNLYTIFNTTSKEEFTWHSLSVDFLFKGNEASEEIGIMLNIKNSEDYRLLRITPHTKHPVIQLLHWKYGYFRMSYEIKLPENLKGSKLYNISIVDAPAIDREHWMPWKIIVQEKETGRVLLREQVENETPAFSLGQVGLYSKTSSVVFSEFKLNTQDAQKRKNSLILPSIFSDGMVLQHSCKNPIWGKATPGREVELHAGNIKLKTCVQKNGNWMIYLPELKANDSLEMEIIAANDTIHIKDIAVGEVWLASGQSNMEMRTWQSDVAKTITRNFTDNKLRIFKQPHWPSENPVFSSGGQWILADSARVMGWSAIAYSFGSRLRKKLNVPVAIICANWGGTAVESWFPREELARNPITKPIFDRYNQSLISLEKQLPLETHFPWLWDVADQSHTPGNLYNGMIAPLIPYSIKGVLWYQGESNTDKARQYEYSFPTLIDSWRQKWNNPELHFFYVQLAGYDGKQSGSQVDSYWPQLRDIQRRVLDKRKNTGMVVAFHLGDSLDIHPYRKDDIGLRLANLALHDEYGFKHIITRGPLFEKVLFNKGKGVVSFRETVNGLTTANNGSLSGFVIAGKDQVFYPAIAVISEDGKKVTVSSDKVADPVAVRYAWINFSSEANLINSANLPASPFRSDNWKLDSDNNL